MSWLHDLERFEAREAEKHALPEDRDVPSAQELRELEQDRPGPAPTWIEALFVVDPDADEPF